MTFYILFQNFLASLSSYNNCLELKAWGSFWTHWLLYSFCRSGHWKQRFENYRSKLLFEGFRRKVIVRFSYTGTTLFNEKLFFFNLKEIFFISGNMRKLFQSQFSKFTYRTFSSTKFVSQEFRTDVEVQLRLCISASIEPDLSQS